MFVAFILISLINPRFPITYRTGEQVFVQAGTSAGLSSGMILPVVTEDGDTIGQVKVLSLNSTSSLCKILEERKRIVPGMYIEVSAKTNLPRSSTENHSASSPYAQSTVSPHPLMASINASFNYQRYSSLYRANIRTLRLSMRYGSGTPERPFGFYLRGHIREIRRGAFPDIPPKSTRLALYTGALSFRKPAYSLQLGRFYSFYLPIAGMTDGIQFLTHITSPISLGVLLGYAARPDSITFRAFRLGGFLEHQRRDLLFRAGILFDQNGGVIRQRFFGTLRGKIVNWLLWSGVQINRYPVDVFGDAHIPEYALTRWIFTAYGPPLHNVHLSVRARLDRIEFTPVLLHRDILPSFQLRRSYGIALSNPLGMLNIDWVNTGTQQFRILGTLYLRSGVLRLTPQLEWIFQDLYTGFNAEVYLSSRLFQTSINGGLRTESVWTGGSSATDIAIFTNVYRFLTHQTYIFASLWEWFGKYRHGVSVHFEAGVRI